MGRIHIFLPIPSQRASDAESGSHHKRPILRKAYPCHDVTISLQWRHNECDGVSNNQPHDCLLNRLYRRRSKKTSKLRDTGLCEGNPPLTGELPVQRGNDAENVSIWWRHHDTWWQLVEGMTWKIIPYYWPFVRGIHVEVIGGFPSEGKSFVVSAVILNNLLNKLPNHRLLEMTWRLSNVVRVTNEHWDICFSPVREALWDVEHRLGIHVHQRHEPWCQLCRHRWHRGLSLRKSPELLSTLNLNPRIKT